MITKSRVLSQIEPAGSDIDVLRLLLDVIAENIAGDAHAEELMPWIDAMLISLEANLLVGVEIWVTETDHRLTTKLQVLNAICQLYEIQLRKPLQR